jgi:hypothetical protein
MAVLDEPIAIWQSNRGQFLDMAGHGPTVLISIESSNMMFPVGVMVEKSRSSPVGRFL